MNLPRCSRTKLTRYGDPRRCTKPALVGGEFCAKHDPGMIRARKAAEVAELERLMDAEDRARRRRIIAERRRIIAEELLAAAEAAFSPERGLNSVPVLEAIETALERLAQDAQEVSELEAIETALERLAQDAQEVSE
jgi:hypothetical protein